MAARFFGIELGDEIVLPGMRIVASADGETVYMHGKWLDLGDDHAVVISIGSPTFKRADGKVLRAGEFPAWIVRGKKNGPSSAIPMAMMFNAVQFAGGAVSFTATSGEEIDASI